MYHVKKIIVINTVNIALCCNLFAAMQQAPAHEQKNSDQQPVRWHQGVMPILEGFLPKVLAVMVRDYCSPDYRTYQHYKTIETGTSIENYQLSSDSKYVLTGHLGQAALWNTQTGTRVCAVNHCHRVQLHPNNLSLLIITNKLALRLLDLKTQQQRTINQKFVFYRALFNRDGSHIFAHCHSKKHDKDYIGLFNTNTGTVVSLQQINKQHDQVTRLGLSQDNILLAYTRGKIGYLATTLDMKDYAQLVGHEDTIDDITISRDNAYALTASWDKTARVWETASGKPLRTFKHPDWVVSVQCSPDRAKFITGSTDGRMRLFEKDSENQSYELCAESLQYDPAFSPDGSLIIAYNYKKIDLWKDPLDGVTNP